MKSLREAELGNTLKDKFTFDFSAPESSTIDVKKLKKFLQKDKNPTLIFYGGEPLLEKEKIMQIMDEISVPFRMQTNGKLLNTLPPKYLNRMGRILVSIDGNKARTDKNKGKGTYDSVMDNLELIQEQGYKGEIVARMTISPDSGSDIYEQVLHLLSTGFTSVHWQIDAGFYKFDYNKEKFEKFVEEYNKGITKLINYWVNDIKEKGRVLKLYPFLGIVHSLLNNEKVKLRCGAGHGGYAITTDRKIIACPIMSSIVDFEAGDLNSKPEELTKFDVGGDCLKCSYKDLCGGRCLYSNKAELWPKEGNELICKTIKHLIDELKNKLPEIQKLINDGTIMLQDFNYEKYFGPEIIP